MNSTISETGTGTSFARRGSRILAAATIAAMTIGAGLVLAPAASAAEGDGAIEGTVLVAGQPAVDGEINVYNSDYSFTTTAAVVDGTYEVAGVPAGADYSVSFEATNPTDEYGFASENSSHYDYDLDEYIYLTVHADSTEIVDFDTKWNFTVDKEAVLPVDASQSKTVTFTEGSVLNAGATSTIQWYLDDVAVDGQTGPSFFVSPDYAGQVLSVTQAVTKPGYATYNWNNSYYIDGPSMVPGYPVIPQDIAVGDTVSVTIDGPWVPAATSYIYDWYAYSDDESTAKVAEEGDGGPFAHSASVVITPDLQGKTIAVNVTGKRSGYIPETRTSNPSDPVAGPKLTTSSTLTTSPAAKIGSTLTASDIVWDQAEVTTSYQWYFRYGKNAAYEISGATGKTFKVTADWAGYALSVRATGTLDGFSDTTVTSASTKAVPYLGTIKPTTPKLSGTFKVGKTVKVSVGSWSPKGLSFDYLWKFNGKVYAVTAKGSYKLPKAAKGKKVTVTVIGYKAGYKDVTKTSSSSSKVK